MSVPENGFPVPVVDLGSPAPVRPPAGGSRREVVHAAAVVGAATLASRIFGFLRDLLVARAFGAGPVTDAFFVAFRAPNLLRRLLAEGALSSAFVPVFTEYLSTRSREDFLRTVQAVSGGLIVVLALTTLAGVIGAPLVVRVLAPGFFADAATGTLAVQLTRLMFPYLFFVGLAALAMAVLNAHRHFLAPALSPIALNVGIIFAVLVVAPRLDRPVFGLAAGVLIGGTGQFLTQLPALAARGALLPPTFELEHPAVRRIFRLLGPVAVGQSASHVSVLVNQAIASYLPGGSISYLYYADRLVEFPLGVFGIAVATAVLPTLSEQAARGDSRAVRETLSFALRLAASISLPAAVALLVLREPMVRVLYQRGQFGPVETTGTAVALGCYALGLVGWTSAKIGTQAFYALGDTRTPAQLGIAAVVLNTMLAAALALPLAHAGLALAASASAIANALALVWLLRRRLGGPAGPGPRAGWIRIVAVSMVLAGFLWGATRLWPPPTGRLGEAAWLGAMVVGGVLLYGGLHVALRSEEAHLARDLLRRRRRSLP